MLADKPLSQRNVAFQGGDAQFVAFNAQDHVVSHTDAQPLTKRSRNHHATVLVDPHAGFQLHVISPSVTLLQYMSFGLGLTALRSCCWMNRRCALVVVCAGW